MSYAIKKKNVGATEKKNVILVREIISIIENQEWG